MPRIKIYKADSLFSRYIRTRDKWTCQRCKHKHEEKSQGLHCSHFISRGKWATRFDPLNCDALCYACHMRWGGEYRQEYKDFKMNQLGEEAYWELIRRGESYCKRDKKKAIEDVKSLVALAQESSKDGL